MELNIFEFLNLSLTYSLYIVIKSRDLLVLCFIMFSLDLNRHLRIWIELSTFCHMFVLCNHTWPLHLISVLWVFFACNLCLLFWLLCLWFPIDLPLYGRRIKLLLDLRRNYFLRILWLMEFIEVCWNGEEIFRWIHMWFFFLRLFAVQHNLSFDWDWQGFLYCHKETW